MTAQVLPNAPQVHRKSTAEFQQELEDRYSWHKEKAELHSKIFKPLGFSFGLAIPLLSALITYAVAGESGIPKSVAAIMGLFLTLLTIMHSVLKPEERFAKAVQHCISLHDWKREFDIHMTEADPQDEAAFHTLIRDLDNKLSNIGKEMAESWVPKPPA